MAIAGVDEAGRGPLAGPVVAAAVVLDPARPIAGINDSKKLSAPRREALAVAIEAECVSACVALASVEEIDQRNILQATFLAMRRALAGLGQALDEARIDGNRLPGFDASPPRSGSVLCCVRPGTGAWVSEMRALIGGDASDTCIGAASILAKVYRDRLMTELDAEFPGYDLARNKGYGTRAHREALARIGPCPAHRRSFAPVAAALRGG